MLSREKRSGKSCVNRRQGSKKSYKKPKPDRRGEEGKKSQTCSAGGKEKQKQIANTYQQNTTNNRN